MEINGKSITFEDLNDILKQIVDVLDKQALRKNRIEKLKKLENESSSEVS